MSQNFVENYRSKHQHPLNRLTHYIGIPTIFVSLAVVFFNWKYGLGLFVLGWIFQFAGHLIEGNQPAFFKNPVYLLVGPWWLLRKVFHPGTPGASTWEKGSTREAGPVDRGDASK